MLFVSAINFGTGITDTDDNVTEFLNYDALRTLKVPVAGVVEKRVSGVGSVFDTALAVPDVLPAISMEALKLGLLVRSTSDMRTVKGYVLTRLYSCLEFAFRATQFYIDRGSMFNTSYLRVYTKFGDSTSEHLGFIVGFGHDSVRLKMQANTDICSVAAYRIQDGTVRLTPRNCVLKETYFLRFGDVLDSTKIHPSVPYLFDNRHQDIHEAYLKADIDIELSKVMLSAYRFILRNTNKISELLKEIE